MVLAGGLNQGKDTHTHKQEISTRDKSGGRYRIFLLLEGYWAYASDGCRTRVSRMGSEVLDLNMEINI